MKKIISLVVSAVLISSFSVTAKGASNDSVVTKDDVKLINNLDYTYEKENKTTSKIIEGINSSVVAIIGKNIKKAENENEYSKFSKNLQHGSGVVIDGDGRLITNNHVIDGLKDIYVVAYDGKAYKAELVYANKEIDLALLKIDRKNLKAINFAKESEINVGDDVIAIGTPLFFGYRNSATKGIISGLNRPVEGTYTYLQTDAAVNPGNSGGPLVNMKGELVGINTLGYIYFQGVNFSIPVNNINYFLDQYKKYGKIKRCTTGIEFEENWAAMLGIPTDQGLRVVTVNTGGIISSNDIKEGDMLEMVDSKAVTSIAQYNEILKNHLPGDIIKLIFTREDKTFEINIVLKEQIER